MRLVISIDEKEQKGMAPSLIYGRLRKECYNRQVSKHGTNFWGLENACDSATRAFYSQMTGRSIGVNSLVLTYNDAENCAKLFSKFADVWIEQELELKKKQPNYFK